MVTDVVDLMPLALDEMHLVNTESVDDVKIKAGLQGDHVELLLRLDHEHFLETLGPGKGVRDRNGSERWCRAELEHADDAWGAAFKVETALARRYWAPSRPRVPMSYSWLAHSSPSMRQYQMTGASVSTRSTMQLLLVSWPRPAGYSDSRQVQ